jgi:DNA adenine methylase
MRHVEPFLGGGAMFFARIPARALLLDINPSLIATYDAVRNDVHKVIAALRRLARSHSPENYYRVRRRYNERSAGRPEQAAMFLYLNKTCFNGLHRVNRHGQFNVPAGRYRNPRIVDEEALLVASTALCDADIHCDRFEGLLERARPGDFVYLDPPYEPVSATANFTAYAEQGFAAEDQIRLRDVFGELNRRGCRLMLSNSDTPRIRELYRAYRMDFVAAPRAVNCDARKRGRVTEVVVRNY